MHRNFYVLLLVCFCGLSLIYYFTNQKTETSATTTFLSAIPNPIPSENLPANEISAAIKSNNVATISHEEALIQKFAPKPITKNISPKKRETVVCPKGTVLTFDPGIFVYEGTSQLVTDSVKIAATEYLTDADFIFAGLTTMCDNHILESGGMIYVSASAGGKNVAIKKGENFQIEIPTDAEKPDMQTFYGKTQIDKDGNERLNWISANYGQLIPDNSVMCGSGYINDATRIPEKKRNNEFNGGIRAMYDYLHDNYTFPKGFEKAQLNATCYVNFLLGADGGIYKVYTSPQIKTYADSQMVEAFKYMPCWSSSVKQNEYAKQMIPIKMRFVHDPTIIPIKMQVNARNPQSKYFASFIDDYYLMASANLGWINCDRFTSTQQSLTDVFVEMDSNETAMVRLVFQDIRSLMSGVRYTKGFRFANVPLNSVVTVVAIKQNGEGFAVAVQECSTNTVKIRNLDYKKMSFEEMTNTFNSLQSSGSNTPLAEANPPTASSFQ